MMFAPASVFLLVLFAAALPLAAADWRVLPLIVNGRIDPAWQQVDWGGFAIDQGALRTQPDPRGMGLLVYTSAAFGDCRIRVVYRSEKPSSNAGVFIRLDPGILQRIGEKTEGVERGPGNQLSPPMLARMTASSENQVGAWYAVHHGFEVQIQDSGDSWHRTGAIYSLAEAAESKARAGSEWRTMIITLEGSRVAVTVDGQPVSRFDSSAKNQPARRSWSEPVRENQRPNKGYIGLQNHDPGDVVWFKEVAIGSLKD